MKIQGIGSTVPAARAPAQSGSRLSLTAGQRSAPTAIKTGERSYEAELHRLQGELQLADDAESHATAESCFRRALDTARRQQARSLELRAAISLGRLWQRQGKQAEARMLLSDVHSSFTEGGDTADLREAQGLLAQLRDRTVGRGASPG